MKARSVQDFFVVVVVLVQDFKEENYKISFRNLKVLNTKKDILCLQVKTFNLINISVFSKIFLQMKTSTGFLKQNLKR